jgi:DNA polymerase III alpha subunit (gram-positive type)
MMRNFVFVDVETTGLDPRNDRLVELTYAVNDGELKTLYNGVKEVPEFIDNLIKFTERGLGEMPRSPGEEFLKFTDDLMDQTMVSANPAFDKAFLEANYLWTGHYRMLDIEAYAMAKFGINFVPSMTKIVEMLNVMGYELTTPDHTSYNDTKALREAFNILRYM